MKREINFSKIKSVYSSLSRNQKVILLVVLLVVPVLIIVSIGFLLRREQAVDKNIVNEEVASGDLQEEDKQLTNQEELGEKNDEVEEESGDSSEESENFEYEDEEVEGSDQQQSDQEDKNEAENSEPEPDEIPDPKIVLCLGDSVTYGTPYGESGNTYPSQLQSLLDLNTDVGSVSVVNRGVGGYRADQVLANVNAWLQANDPDIVLLMVGGNDLRQDLDMESTPGEIANVIDQTVAEVQQIISAVKSYTNGSGKKPKIIVSAFIPNNYEGVFGSLAVSYYNFDLASDLYGYDNYFTTNWGDLYDINTFQANTSLMADQLHPNAEGYGIIAQNWYEVVVTLF